MHTSRDVKSVERVRDVLLEALRAVHQKYQRRKMFPNIEEDIDAERKSDATDRATISLPPRLRSTDSTFSEGGKGKFWWRQSGGRHGRGRPLDECPAPTVLLLRTGNYELLWNL